MESLKVCVTGLQMLHKLEQMIRQAEWVGLGSFGFDCGLELWRHLPKSSQIVVGLPRNEADAERRGGLIRRLSYFKKAKPDLHISVRDDFHAKYCILRMPRSLWVMVGSANCTPSPAHEVVVFAKSDSMFNILAKKHERWFVTGTFVKPDNTPKLSRSDLASLSSTVVGGK